MSEREMTTSDVVRKLVNSMIQSKNHAFAVGYLETMLISTIELYVKDETELSMIHIRMLGSAIDFQLDSKEAG